MNAVRTSCLLTLSILTTHISGCATPAQHLDARAAEYGYRKVVLQGAGFSHVAYFKDAGKKNGDALHVYLDGDGSPWIGRKVPATDPTPHNPLMLDLMALDPVPSVYLGRPCYHGMGGDACSPVVWTDGRYSERVVKSMSAALDGAGIGYSSLVLIGHSGGGTLAMLLAERQPKVTVVVTVAANLDTERWSAMHGQRQMEGSLNPALRAPLRASVRQMHYAGADDDNVPPQLVRDAVAQQPAAKFKVYPKQGHSCCWRDVWPEILGALAVD